MVLDQKRKLGRTISELTIGEKCKLSEKMTDKDLLLYLGLSDDNNPLFIQHDYASLTPYEKPIVPQIMLIGIVTSAISKIFPGPGSSIRQTSLDFPRPVYHDAIVYFTLEILEINPADHIICISVQGIDEGLNIVVQGTIDVMPPYPPRTDC